jgi:hypothetical protein
MITGAVYEARMCGSVRGMRREPHPTRYGLLWGLGYYRKSTQPVETTSCQGSDK